jgi:hypothetical protein
MLEKLTAMQFRTRSRGTDEIESAPTRKRLCATADRLCAHFSLGEGSKNAGGFQVKT